MLLEDGKPREFTIFDSPATQGRMPLELVLLFDANPPISFFWDPVEVFRFIPEWTEEMSREILTADTANIRISVYRCARETLYPMLRATTDAAQLTDTLRSLLKPEWRGPGRGGEPIALSLPAQRQTVPRGAFTNDYPTSPFISQEYRGWPMEAAIGTLNEMAATQDKVARVMVMFSEGIGATTTIPEDLGNQALDLGIPIYPVATNYQGHIDSAYPRNLFRMREFESLGKMTGGREVEYTQINAATLRKILSGVKNHGLSEYVVGFVPPASSGTSRQHRLEIKLASKSSGSLEGGKRRAIY
ncbi:MAG: hypothetical protein WBY44_36445 [Bryobacteraceae bacterium]